MKLRPTRMVCREAFERWYAYLDRELTQGHTAAVRAPEHLKKRILRVLLFHGTKAEPE